MHLVYLDDSGSDKGNQVLIAGGVMLDDVDFWKIDLRSSVIVEALIPPEKLDDFEEFRAAELFGGYGVFHGVDEERRHSVIRAVLNLVSKFKLPVIYAAVSKKDLETSAFGSSLPIDVAFRVCLCGIQDMVSERVPYAESTADRINRLAEHSFLVIADDTDDKAVKNALKKSCIRLAGDSMTRCR